MARTTDRAEEYVRVCLHCWHSNENRPGWYCCLCKIKAKKIWMDEVMTKSPDEGRSFAKAGTFGYQIRSAEEEANGISADGHGTQQAGVHVQEQGKMHGRGLPGGSRVVGDATGQDDSARSGDAGAALGDVSKQ